MLCGIDPRGGCDLGLPASVTPDVGPGRGELPGKLIGSFFGSLFYDYMSSMME
jgi:hypothetical protein